MSDASYGQIPAGVSVSQWIRAECLALHRDRWLDIASHRDCSIIFMYRNIEIVTQQEPPAIMRYYFLIYRLFYGKIGI